MTMQVSDRVEVNCPKYQGSGVIAELYEGSLALQVAPLEVLKDIPHSAVTSVDSSTRLKRESFIKAFLETDFADGIPDVILDNGKGSILYYGPTGDNIIAATCWGEGIAYDKQRIFIVPFIGGSLVRIPEAIDGDRDLDVVGIKPFRISAIMFDEDGKDLGKRNKNQELLALQGRLEALLSSCHTWLTTFHGNRDQCIGHVKKAFGGFSWAYTGAFEDGLLDTLPETGNSTFLCGHEPAGVLYRVPGNKFCIVLDTRKLVRVSID